ncbi:MAG: hypothetical protein ACHQYO_04975 [Halanaerobiales bacterium]
MTIKVYLNKIGFPEIAELPELERLPGIGEKITLEENKRYEVTEVKKDPENDEIYIYVNTAR